MRKSYKIYTVKLKVWINNSDPTLLPYTYKYFMDNGNDSFAAIENRIKNQNKN